jgi:5'-nucleotidase
VPGSVLLNGRPVPPDAVVRITVNNFMADGGDGVTLLRQGRDRQPGPLDIDALEAYVKATPNLGPDPVPRVKRLN